jgi:hypothetical protein
MPSCTTPNTSLMIPWKMSMPPPRTGTAKRIARSPVPSTGDSTPGSAKVSAAMGFGGSLAADAAGPFTARPCDLSWYSAFLASLARGFDFELLSASGNSVRFAFTHAASTASTWSCGRPSTCSAVIARKSLMGRTFAQLARPVSKGLERTQRLRTSQKSPACAATYTSCPSRGPKTRAGCTPRTTKVS